MFTSIKALAALAFASAVVSGSAATEASAGPARGIQVSPVQSRLNITCLGCQLPRPYHPPHWHWRWDHHFTWFRYQPIGYVVPSGGAPVVTSASPNPARTADAVQPQADARCLTKQYLPDGRAVFQDVCTHEEAVSEAKPAPGPKVQK
jgi:hypothetical protein